MMLLFYIPFPELDSARNVAAKALEERLSACVNILPKGVSLYLWPDEKGVQRLQEGEEVIALFKTTEAKEKQLEEFITQEHPYDCPAILRIQADANEHFMDWMQSIL